MGEDPRNVVKKKNARLGDCSIVHLSATLYFFNIHPALRWPEINYTDNSFKSSKSDTIISNCVLFSADLEMAGSFCNKNSQHVISILQK